MADVAIVTFNQPPGGPASLKYTDLAPIGVGAARRYAARHGYAFYGEAPRTEDRPACWGKLTAVNAALDRHEWVFWVDADAVAQPGGEPLAPLIPAEGDLVCEDPATFLGWLGLDPAAGRRMQPMHSAVFGLRRGRWARDLLAAAWERREWITQKVPWNGLGEQEALNAVLKRMPAHAAALRYVDGLQASPALATPTTRFVQFYGDRAQPRWSEAASRAVLARYGRELAAGLPSSRPLALVHWCAIQATDGAGDRGGPERFGYDAAALDTAIRDRACAA